MSDNQKKKSYSAWMVLGAITIVAALCLAVVYEITKGPIREQEKVNTEKTIKALMPIEESAGSLSFEDVLAREENSAFKASTGLTALYECKQGENVVGYVGTAVVTGFGGKVQVMVGVDAQGNITGIDVGGSDFSETAGLGAKAKGTSNMENGNGFVDQFAGKGTDSALWVRKTEAADDYAIDAITAATITSKAVTGGVNEITGEIKNFMNMVNKNDMPQETGEEDTGTGNDGSQND